MHYKPKTTINMKMNNGPLNKRRRRKQPSHTVPTELHRCADNDVNVESPPADCQTSDQVCDVCGQ